LQSLLTAISKGLRHHLLLVALHPWATLVTDDLRRIARRHSHLIATHISNSLPHHLHSFLTALLFHVLSHWVLHWLLRWCARHLSAHAHLRHIHWVSHALLHLRASHWHIAVRSTASHELRIQRRIHCCLIVHITTLTISLLGLTKRPYQCHSKSICRMMLFPMGQPSLRRQHHQLYHPH
jgi:hypothetical protein